MKGCHTPGLDFVCFSKRPLCNMYANVVCLTPITSENGIKAHGAVAEVQLQPSTLCSSWHQQLKGSMTTQNTHPTHRHPQGRSTAHTLIILANKVSEKEA
ncbi:hypothetical protein Baya_2502 [Bagarius yarrelli]|uniref:Uncharacterized protein n=1 Tax=Bagarius yarrelli TaxID=175774 RepID=A0A556VXP6_BAGYA|nr:hypothetical protein Baya_2502 [Bagarius yarrelli]